MMEQTNTNDNVEEAVEAADLQENSSNSEAVQASDNSDAVGGSQNDNVEIKPAIETKDSQKDEIEAVYVDIENARLHSILESLLFISEKPVTKNAIYATLHDIHPKQIDACIDELLEKYQADDYGIQLHKVGGGFQLRTHPDNSEYLLRLQERKPVRLSRANLETLAIVAYRQPITRPEVDEIRGVDSGHMLRTLIDRNLIKILGKREEAGNPLIYGTSNEFLEFFQINNLSDLPSLTEYTELGEESLQKLEKLLPTPQTIQAAQESNSETQQNVEASLDQESNVLETNNSDLNNTDTSTEPASSDDNIDAIAQQVMSEQNIDPNQVQ